MSVARRRHKLDRLSPEWRAEYLRLWRFLTTGACVLMVSVVLLGVTAQSARRGVVLGLLGFVLMALAIFVVVSLVWTFRLYSSGRRMVHD